MKNTWIVCCMAALALAPVARGDGNPSPAAPAAPVVASATTSLKAAWPLSDAPTHRLVAHGVPNFGKLNADIWRSGQPTRAGYQLLAQEGLKTVVNLRAEFPQDKDLIPQGVRYVYIPIKDEKAPTDEQAKEFLAVAENPANWPLLVHCHGGEGRAGVMAALLRHSIDGWDHNKIMKEVGNFRTKYLGFITVGMASCQQQFIKHWEEMPQAADTAKN